MEDSPCRLVSLCCGACLAVLAVAPGAGSTPGPPGSAIHLKTAVSSATTLQIWEIQGSGMASPHQGELVTTAASVVTAVGRQGFFIQTPEASSDGNPATSDGLYVYTGSAPPVDAGDLVEVTGTVQEYYDLTEISGQPTTSILGSGEPLPSPVAFSPTLPSPDQPQPANELERFEGMLVEVVSGTVTGPTDQYGNFTAVARSTRSYREPGIIYPGLPGLPMWDGNPEIFEVDPDALGLDDLSVDSGVAIDRLVGPLSFSFGYYQVWPITLQLGAPATSRPSAPRRRADRSDPEHGTAGG